MTKNELSQLNNLNREIEMDKRRLAELRAAATSTVSSISGLPHAAGKSDKTGLAADIAHLTGVIENKIQRTVYEYNRLINYIYTVDDSLIRQILTLRYVNGYRWVKVAMAIGGGNTCESVRKAHDRYLGDEQRITPA